jgi:hypothetical protein
MGFSAISQNAVVRFVLACTSPVAVRREAREKAKAQWVAAVSSNGYLNIAN